MCTQSEAKEAVEAARKAWAEHEECMAALGWDHKLLRDEVGKMGSLLSKLHEHLNDDTNETKETEVVEHQQEVEASSENITDAYNNQRKKCVEFEKAGKVANEN